MLPLAQCGVIHAKHLKLQVLICECYIVAEYRGGSKLLCGGGSKKPATDSRPREIFWTRQDWLDDVGFPFVRHCGFSLSWPGHRDEAAVTVRSKWCKITEVGHAENHDSLWHHKHP